MNNEKVKKNSIYIWDTIAQILGICLLFMYTISFSIFFHFYEVSFDIFEVDSEIEKYTYNWRKKRWIISAIISEDLELFILFDLMLVDRSWPDHQDNGVNQKR